MNCIFYCTSKDAADHYGTFFINFSFFSDVWYYLFDRYGNV